MAINFLNNVSIVETAVSPYTDDKFVVLDSGVLKYRTSAQVRSDIGAITASSSDTLTNKSGNISQWTNDSGYLTSASLPTVNNGTLTMTTSTGLDGAATFTANQSGNSTFSVSLDLSELLDMTAAMTSTDEFIVLDSSTQRRKAAGEIGLSIFDNDEGFITSSSLPTVNNNSITISAGTNLSGGGTFTLNQNFNETVTINMETGGIGSGTYGSTANGTKIDNITVDAYGRVTAITTGATGSGNGTVTGSGTANYVSKWTSSSVQGNSTIYDNGNVGIGTNDPDAKLEISTSSAPILRLTSTDTSVNTGESIGRLEFKSNDVSTGGNNVMGFVDCLATNAGTTYALALGTGLAASATEKMRIDEQGDVGIGTSNPGAKLDVNQDAAAVAFNVTGGSGGASLATFTRDVGATGSSVSINAQSNFPQIQFANTGNTFSIGGDSSGNFKISDNTSIGTNDRITIDNTGNVGIGTTDPTAQLDIFNAGGNATSLSLAQTYSGLTVKPYSAVDSKLTFSANSGNTQIIQATNNSGSTGRQIALQPFNGNVGIGTTSPATKLEVEGGDALIQLSTTSSSGSPYMSFAQNGSRKSYIQHSDSGDTLKLASEYGGIDFFTGTSGAETEKMTIQSGGNVGIGVTNPVYDLEVDGMIAATTSTANSASKGFAMKNGNYDGTNKINSYYGAWVSSVSMYIGGYLGYSYQPIAASAFNVNSDYRLKSNVGPLENAISRLNQLEVHRFNWNDKLDDPKVDGFIAHEVKEIVPEAVTGEKDELWPDGNPKYQGIDQAKLVPLLTAALQEAITKIETLETRIDKY